VALTVLATYHVADARADYTKTPTTWESETDPQYYRTSTRWEEALASADPHTSGYVTCGTDTFAQAKDTDSAYAYASAQGEVTFTWEWDGTPGTPPGGELSWYHAGDGFAQARGSNWYVTGSDQAFAGSDAAAATAVASPTENSWSGGSAYGEVSDLNQATGDAYAEGEPTPYSIDPNESTGSDTEKSWFSYTVEWDTFYEPDPEIIPSGTTYFQVGGEVACICQSDTSTSQSGVLSESEVTAYASVYAHAEFEP
jgi:hypothetical protein